MAKASRITDKALSSLGRGVDKANKKAGKKKLPPPPTAPAPAATAPQTKAKFKRVSVSLYPADLECIDSIQDHMRTQGHRITRSQAVKLALRTAPLTADMIEAHEAIKAEDGRRWQSY